MNAPAPEPRGGGIFLALGPIIGAVVGIFLGQSTIGLLAGMAIGVLLAAVLWLADRRREGRNGQ